jgi:hypothetical protein
MKQSALADSWPVNLRRSQAARYLREMHGIPIAPATLAKWFCIRSDGPPAFCSGRIPLYPRAELDVWAVRRLGTLRTSTSDGQAPK